MNACICLNIYVFFLGQFLITLKDYENILTVAVSFLALIPNGYRIFER